MQRLYELLIHPRSVREDARRAERILNILLLGAVGLAAVAWGVTLVAQAGHMSSDSGAVVRGLVSLLVVMGLLALSRAGWHRLVAYLIVGLFLLAASYTLVRWSIDLPVGLLLLALVVVMSGVLLGTRITIIITLAEAAALIGIGELQAHNTIIPDTLWRHQPIAVADVAVFVVVLVIIALVSGLFNYEIDGSLRRARASEAALKDERDRLEDRVVERTRELEQAQLERMLELQRFAEFGRFSAGLLHDLANPLMAASLNLEQLNEGPRSKLIHEASQSLRYLERYIDAARKQLQQESEVKSFAVGPELNQVVAVLAHKAKAAAVKVVVRRGAGRLRLHGDPVKFSQLAANLIANAIEAYAEAPPSPGSRRVVVEVVGDKQAVVLTVQDWGVGVAAADIPHLFDPFYTTKRANSRSIGIGLAMVKQIVDDDFKGSIKVTSTPAEGTRFVARLRHGRPPQPRR